MFGSLESRVNKRIVGGAYQQGHTENQQEGRDGQTGHEQQGSMHQTTLMGDVLQQISRPLAQRHTEQQRDDP